MEEVAKRKSIRFSTDENTLALIELEPNSTDFEPQCVGLIVDESRHGSGIVMLKRQAPQIGQSVRIKMGRLPLLNGRCAWSKDLDDHVVRIGVDLID